MYTTSVTLVVPCGPAKDMQRLLMFENRSPSRVGRIWWKNVGRTLQRRHRPRI